MDNKIISIKEYGSVKITLKEVELDKMKQELDEAHAKQIQELEKISALLKMFLLI